MGLLGDLTGLGTVARSASEVTKSITDLIGRFIPDPNQRMQAQNELQRILAEAETAKYNASAQVMAADAASDSGYTRNARPTVVYWSLGMITLVVATAPFGAADQIVAALAKVPDKLYEMITVGVGIFTAGRTIEKGTNVVAKTVEAVVNSRRR